MDLIHLIKIMINIAILCIASGMIHEIGHILACLILNCRIIEVKIWIFKIKRGNNTINISFAFIEKEHGSFLTSNKVRMLIVMVSGSVFRHRSIAIICGIIYNIIIPLYELNPKNLGDGFMINKAINEIRIQRNEANK